jgi:hypothetical protein
MEIEPHRHHVRLNLLHSEMNVDYGFGGDKQLSFRLPYDQKAVDVRYTTLDGAPFDPPYGDIHHRDETLSGFSDPDLLLLFAPERLQRGRSKWIIGAGFSIPLGKTEEDPVRLGREGKRHEHLQFGTGTFAPRVTLRYLAPIPRGVVQGSMNVQVPLYENSHGFLAPRSLQLAAGPTWRVSRYTFSTEIAAQVQSQGRWSGELDEGTGFRNGGVQLRLGIPIGAEWRIAPSIYHELYSHGMHDESFEQGNTFSLSISRIVR